MGTLRVTKYDPYTGIVCFEEETEICIDSDCGSTSITLYCEKESRLGWRERQVLEEYKKRRLG